MRLRYAIACEVITITIVYVITIDILIAIACSDCECRNGFFSNVEGVFSLTS